jgi:hypothetical protein
MTIFALRDGWARVARTLTLPHRQCIQAFISIASDGLTRDGFGNGSALPDVPTTTYRVR